MGFVDRKAFKWFCSGSVEILMYYALLLYTPPIEQGGGGGERGSACRQVSVTLAARAARTRALAPVEISRGLSGPPAPLLLLGLPRQVDIFLLYSERRAEHSRVCAL